MLARRRDATWAAPLVSDEGAVFADFLEYLRPHDDCWEVRHG